MCLGYTIIFLCPFVSNLSILLGLSHHDIVDGEKNCPLETVDSCKKQNKQHHIGKKVDHYLGVKFVAKLTSAVTQSCNTSELVL